MPTSLPTIAEVFKQAGYNTYAEVTGPLLPATGVLRGFDEHRHRPGYGVPFFGWRDEVLSQMRSYADPWFMLLHVWEVHRPYRSPPRFEKRNDKEGYERALSATDESLVPILEAAGNAVFVVTGDHGEDYATSRAEEVVLAVARRARRYLNLKKWLPPLDRAIAAAEIGHGFALYEHLIRVPLVLAGPGVRQTEIGQQVRHVDLLPTLADLCNLPIPDDADGRSLRPLMEGAPLDEEPAYMEAVGVKLGGDRLVGARIPGWKLLRRNNADPQLVRLDATDKKAEKRNVIAEHPDVASELDAYITRMQAYERGTGSGMSSEEEAVVEQHLRDLGYL